MCSNFSLTKLGKKHLAATVGQALIKIYFNALFAGQPVDRRTRLSLESFVSTPMIIARGGGVKWGKGGQVGWARHCNKTIFSVFCFFPRNFKTLVGSRYESSWSSKINSQCN